MHVTSKLFKVFQVEKQIRGLKSRLTSAERFLAEQDKQLALIDGKKANIDGLLKQALVAAKSAEGEMARQSKEAGALEVGGQPQRGAVVVGPSPRRARVDAHRHHQPRAQRQGDCTALDHGQQFRRSRHRS